jgi:hypothetical protein
MKKVIYLFAVLITTVLFNSCKDDLVNEEGLTDDITNLVPDSILTIIKDMGMPINGGANPPVIQNSYLISPFVLVNSNIDSDIPGHKYNDFIVTFYDQNNKDLTISMNYDNYPETGTGLGAFVVGENDEFSVFAEVQAKSTDGSKAKVVMIFSGKWTEEGIKDIYFANFVIDNYGNETGFWIENGQGRIIYDSDGFSPVTDKLKNAINLDVNSAGGK